MKTSSSAAAATGVRGPDCRVPAKLTGSPRMAATPAAALNRSNRRREKLFLSSAIESLLRTRIRSIFTALEVRLCTNSVSAGTDGRGGIRFSRYPFPGTALRLSDMERIRLIGHLKFSLCLLVFAWGALTQANGASLLVRGGTLIDGTGGVPIANARILITDGRIARVWSGDTGAPALPAGTEIVEAGGKFIIPGLIDSHVHYNWYMGELFLTHGVTTVFDLGGGPVWSSAVQKGLNSGQIVGPRYYFHSVFGGGGTGQTDPLAGTNTAKMRFAANVNTPADAPKGVAALKGKADIITLNEDWKADYFKAVAGAAHASGLSIISHSFNALDTSDWGVDGIEHMTGVGIAAARSPEAKKAVAAMGFCTHQYAPILEQSLPCIAAGHKNSKLYQWMDTSYFEEMIQDLVKNHTFLNPTLDFEWKGIIDRTPQFELEDQKLFFNPALQYVPEDERLVTLGQYHWADARDASDREQFLTGYKKVQEFLRKFVA